MSVDRLMFLLTGRICLDKCGQMQLVFLLPLGGNMLNNVKGLQIKFQSTVVLQILSSVLIANLTCLLLESFVCLSIQFGKHTQNDISENINLKQKTLVSFNLQ